MVGSAIGTKDMDNSGKISSSGTEGRYMQIAQSKEMIWRQKAKRQWIREGDKNIIYFNTIATIQKRQNIIHTLKDSQGKHTDHNTKAKVLFHYFCDLMGREYQVAVNFDYAQLFNGRHK
jgi:hypothetical protein